MSDMSLQTNPLGVQSLAMEALDNDNVRYDSAYIAAGTTYAAMIPLLVLFQVPRGQTGNGYTAAKTFAETNMRVQGILEKDVQCTIRHCVVQVTPLGGAPGGDATLQYMAQYIQDSEVRLIVDRAEEVIEHLVVFAGVGLTGVANPNAGASDGWVSGQPSVIGGEDWSVTTGILPNTPFRIEIVPNANAVTLAAAVPNAFSITVHLIGSFTRPVLC